MATGIKDVNTTEVSVWLKQEVKPKTKKVWSGQALYFKPGIFVYISWNGPNKVRSIFLTVVQSIEYVTLRKDGELEVKCKGKTNSFNTISRLISILFYFNFS